MNILFLTLLDFNSLEEHNIYTDLLKEIYKNGHTLHIISPVERRKNADTKMVKIDEKLSILKLKIGNTQKTNIIEKGISTVTLEGKFIAAIKKYYSDVKFDAVLYSTPPITLQKAVEYVKKRDDAKTYLMLKDIFPQNAVDLGMLSKEGIKRLLYSYFRRKEKKLYAISDKIGCMSQANIDYVLEHNSMVEPSKVEMCPNAVAVRDLSMPSEMKNIMREKYNIPKDKIVFVYGGNLGKPQGIDFLLECVKSQQMNEKIFFLIVGSGTEYQKLDDYVKEHRPVNFKLMNYLPKEDYDSLIGSCDIGMIFLNEKFTIPNFPSRMLSYLQAKLPILVVTDKNTDIGKIILEYECGWWCESGDVEQVERLIEQIVSLDIQQVSVKRQNCWKCLCEKYDVEKVAISLLNSIEQ